MGSTLTLSIVIIGVWLFVVKGMNFSTKTNTKHVDKNPEKIQEIEKNLPNYVTGNSSTTGGLPYGAALQNPKKENGTTQGQAYRENRGANRN